MAKSGLRPLFNTRDMDRMYDKFQDRTEWVIRETLKFSGDRFVELARLNGAYKDQTGNLRASIGYCVVENGNIVEQGVEQGSEGKEGVQKARQLLAELANEHNTGMVLIGVAGMDYALHVENIAGRDVISGSAKEVEIMLRTSLKKAMLR